MPKMTHRGTTRMNRNRRAERRSAWAEGTSALRPAEGSSALQAPDAIRRYLP